MNTFRKRLSRTIPVFFAVLFLGLSIAGALPAPKAAAANSVTQPIVWIDNQHSYAVSANNVPFRPVGFICSNVAGPSGGLFTGSGANISVGNLGKPNDKKISVPKDTEAGSGVDKKDVPTCSNAKGDNFAASYVWVTSFKNGDNFALIVNGTANGIKNSIDAQHKPVGGSNSTYAAIYKIGGNGSISNQKEVKEIKVDTSKAKYADKDNSGDEKGDDTISEDNCPIKDWALRWIACPITVAANEAILKIEGLVTGMLATDVDNIFGSSTAAGTLNQSGEAKAYYQAWNSFRILAIAVIIILAVLMVVSEATGLGFFDAYAIRKLLPRLLIAAIIIALSWWLLKFMVQFFNNISVWLGGALAYPFTAGDNPILDKESSPWSIVGNYAVIIGAILALGPWGILSYVGTVFLAMLAALVTLTIRKILMVLAIVMAPLFIAFYIAPNTQKLGKFWWSGFLGLNMMMLIFILIMVAGRITSKLSADADPFGIIAFVCLIAPLVLLPVAFVKVAGSAAAIIGFANNKATGGFDRLKNFRKGQVQQRGERAKSGELFGNGLVRGGAASKLNTLTTRAGLGARANFGMGAKGREAYEQKVGLMAANYMKSDAGQAMQFNDTANKLLSYGSEAEARRGAMGDDWGNSFKKADGTFDKEKFDGANAAVKANGGYGVARSRAAILALAKTGTGMDDVQQVTKAIGRYGARTGNKSEVAALAGTVNSMMEVRHDMKIGVGDYIKYSNQEMDALTGAKDQSGNAIQAPSARDYRRSVIKGLDSVDTATLLRGDKTKSIENISRALTEEMADSQRDMQSARTARQRYDAEYHLGANVRRAKKMQENGLYASNANLQAFTQGVVNRDRGEARPDGTRTGPNIIQNVTNEVRQQTAQNVTYTPKTDRSGNTVYVQNVQRTSAPAPGGAGLTQGFNDFDTSRNMHRDDDNLVGPGAGTS